MQVHDQCIRSKVDRSLIGSVKQQCFMFLLQLLITAAKYISGVWNCLDQKFTDQPNPCSAIGQHVDRASFVRWSICGCKASDCTCVEFEQRQIRILFRSAFLSFWYYHASYFSSGRCWPKRHTSLAQFMTATYRCTNPHLLSPASEKIRSYR
jgi:hypothetical protein